jgi:hypothetical protein
MSDDRNDTPGYLGAMLDEERRLVLVPLDPEQPWAAFRMMRSWMKRSRRAGITTTASMSVFAARRSGADVIELRARTGREN